MLYIMKTYTRIDFEKIEGFDWDAGNARKSDDKHQVSHAEVEQVFFNVPLVLAPDVKHSQTEPPLSRPGEDHCGKVVAHSFHAEICGEKNPPHLRPRNASQGATSL
jgi:uncharacterized protein